VGHGTTGALGDRAEQLAHEFLLQKGLRPVARNFRSRGGEIDLIMLHERCLAFIEVRYRRSSGFMKPVVTVDRHKQRKIIRTAAMFTARNHQFANLIMRFDVVALEGADPPAINWIRDAFRPNDSTL
jgi:putative endonuclease